MFKIGDAVKSVNSECCWGFKAGTEGTVIGISSSSGRYIVEGLLDDGRKVQLAQCSKCIEMVKPVFEKGDFVVCTYNSNYEEILTVGGIYEVTSFEGKFTKLIGDSGHDTDAYSWRFKRTDGEYIKRRCINPGPEANHLTSGKEYITQKEGPNDNGWFYVMCDDHQVRYCFSFRFELPKETVETPVKTPDVSWTFEITNESQVLLDEIAQDLNRKNPVAVIDEDGSGTIEFLVHVSLQYKLKELGVECPQDCSIQHLNGYTYFRFDRGTEGEFLDNLKFAMNKPWPSTGRRKVTVTLPSFK